MKGLISEEINVELGLASLDGAGARTTARIDMKSDARMRFVLRLEVGIGTTLDLKLEQHDLGTAGVTSDLVLLTPIHYLVDAGAWVKVQPSDANILIADLDTAAGIVVLDIEPSSLADGNRYVSLTMAAPGATRVSTCLAESNYDFRPVLDDLE